MTTISTEHTRTPIVNVIVCSANHLQKEVITEDYAPHPADIIDTVTMPVVVVVVVAVVVFVVVVYVPTFIS